jgi:IS30 family transposase
MEERRRRGLTALQRGDLWRRWKEGQSLSDIARALGKNPGSVHGYLSNTGGIAPATRDRGTRALTLHEREEISRGLCAGASLRGIAKDLGRPPSTVSREVARNGGRRRYRAAAAEARAWKSGRRPKTCKLARHVRLLRIPTDPTGDSKLTRGLGPR